ncbi:bacterio-opsin activator domain-containing protein [Natronoarchaeum mannanilyticum]|uniref:DNA-binding protein n=1 Tax=Natronoarchaeum mannanilyticum TaxID=926360 RepID=A0AAV3T5L0_9EURY
MAAIAEFTLPAADFPLGRVFEERPDVTLELDRVVPTGDTVMPFFWVTDPTGDLGSIRDLFEDLPELRSATLMEIVDDRGLFSAEWKPEYMGIMAAVGATGVTVLSATGSTDGWVFELRAASMDQFSEFQRYCDDHDIDVDLTRLSRLSETSPDDEYNLTPEQREALVLAYREGYYDDAGRPDQDALAAQFGISRQALSARLRRGYRNLIESTLVRGHRDDES